MRRLVICLALLGSFGCKRKDVEHPSAEASPSGSAEAAEPAASGSATSAAASAASAATAAPSASAVALGGPAWTYGGQTGPSFWGDLEPSFSPCKTGLSQSPIDIPSKTDAPSRGAAARPAPKDGGKDGAKDGAKDAPKEPVREAPARETSGDSGGLRLSVDYLPVPLEIQNDGRGVRIANKANNYLSVGGRRYELIDLAFHSPSEHTLAGKRFEVELQLTHKAADGKVAVVAVLFAPGETVPELAEVWKRLPKQPTREPQVVKGKPFDVAPLVSLSEGYYVYDGSMTTPPCTEGVTWFVMKKTATIATKDVERYRALFGGRTNRMVMPLGGRKVLELRP